MRAGRWRLGVLLSLVVLSCFLAACAKDAALDGRLSAMTPDERKEFKESLEVRKLTLEVEALASRPLSWLPSWVVTAVGPGLGLLIPGLLAVYLSRRTRLAQLKQTLHEKRLESYPNLVKAAKPLALYLSRIEESSPGDIIEKLKEMGLAMRNWYLDEGGGLLLSAQTRDAYFLLARALTRACAVQGSLRFPKRGAWLEVSQEKVQKYGKELRLPKATRLRKWQNARLRNGITQGQWRSGRSASSPI